MAVEAFMVKNCDDIRAASNGVTNCWVYRNGIKALPWHESVRKLLEDRSQWGLFMPLAGCMPSPGQYVCGPNATQNLFHDFEQTPKGDCGVGVECGEYVFNHRNASLIDFLLGEYFFPSPFPSSVTGYYVDDDWSEKGPSEMDPDSCEKMGMSPSDIAAMTAAWSSNQQTWRDALVAKGLFEWFLLYGGQQTAPGQNQTCGKCTCQSYLEAQCGPLAGSQNGTLFYGYSRTQHSVPFPLPTPTQDLTMFMLSRGPFAFFGYGWTGCVDKTHPFTHPPELDADYGVPLNFCSETSKGSGVWTRNFTKADFSMDCSSFTADIIMK